MPTRSRRTLGRLLVAAALLTLSACRSTGGSGGAEENARPHLYAGFDNYGRQVSTDSALAQRFVDQGLQWLYGFNDDEAIRCFREAARLDPDCAFPWWGIAYAYGINVNDPVMSETESREAFAAVQEAQARRAGASDVEKDLIDAIAKRYAWPPPKETRPSEEAFAAALGEGWGPHPHAPHVGAH
jgi:hypothetical protein